jgi:hypothetical protein
LPTRIIEVGQHNSPENKVVSLRDSAAGEKEKYLILSHRWVGTSTFDRFEEMKATGLSLDALPILFQDAVKLTRLLKVPYLWIDSICIDQKNEYVLSYSIPANICLYFFALYLADSSSRDDKAREVPQMAGYYENAYLTICAACCSETQLGFLKSTGHRRIRIVNCATSDGHTFDIIIKEHSSKFVLEMSERGDPVHHRAWVYQEFLLSPRIISYGSSEMEWYCRDDKGDWCECLDIWPQGTHGELVCKPHASFWRRCRRALAAKSSDSWREIVEEYSRRALTFDSDRLNALHSIAAHFGDPSDGSYLGGTWSLQEDILTSLQWKVNSIGTLPESRRGPAPSWTWASIEGCVCTTPIQKWDQGVTIIQAPIAAPADDHSSRLLTLQGPLIKARLDVVNARPLKWSETGGRDLYWFTPLPISAGGASSIGSWAWDVERGRNMPRIMFAPDTPFEPGPVLSGCLTDSPMRVTFRRANKSLNDEFTAMSGVVYCLRFSSIGNEGPNACMVILSRINGPSGNVYERLGVAWVWHSVDTAGFFADVGPTTVNFI